MREKLNQYVGVAVVWLAILATGYVVFIAGRYVQQIEEWRSEATTRVNATTASLQTLVDFLNQQIERSKQGQIQQP